MKESVAKKWIATLTSGKYKQTSGQLAKFYKDGTPRAYCCLGVLCEVYNKEQKDPNEKVSNEELNDSFPPSRVIEWAGANNRCFNYQGKKATRSLANDNDEAHRRFPTIVKIIEREWKVL